MASKKTAKTKKKTPPRAKKSAKPRVMDAAKKAGTTKGRTLPEKSAVLAACVELDRANNRNKQTGDGLKEGLDLARERGVDVPMVRLAQRFRKLAKDSPIGASIKWENFKFYMECIEFDKMIAPSMFKAEEVRSGKKDTKPEKTNGKNGHDKKQTSLKLVPAAETASPVAAEENAEETTSVH